MRGLRSRCTAFAGTRRIASGELLQVARSVKEHLARDEREPVLIFDDHTSELVELDLRGAVEQALARLSGGGGENPTENDQAADAPSSGTRRPGRPRLGVVGREVTLLPRHWEWLGSQPGGASVVLRRLVDLARKENEQRDRVRRAREVTYRFLSAMAGNEPGYEEALRALFAGNQARFLAESEAWPTDVRDHARELAAVSFAEQSVGLEAGTTA